jgi:ribosomal protein S18 acetylase RimI-like enzyme
LKSSDVDIRRLTPADAVAYRALRLRALREHPDAFTSSHAEDLAKPLAATERRIAPDSPDWVFGGFVASGLAGIVGLARELRAKNRHKADVFGMYVASEHAKRGIGAELLRHAIAAARSQSGLEQLVLTVTDTNVSGRKLYEKFGFRSFGIEPRAIRVDDVYYDKNHMILFLAQP